MSIEINSQGLSPEFIVQFIYSRVRIDTGVINHDIGSPELTDHALRYVLPGLIGRHIGAEYKRFAT
jgi:hypothetical protein